jgi:cysteine-rich repeat protein
MLKRSSLIAALLCSFSLVVPASAAVTPNQKCASAKMKAAGKRLSGEAKCYSKALMASAAVDPVCLQSAATKFTEAFTKAETGDCRHDGDAGTIGVKIDAAIEDIAGDIGCGDGAGQGDESCDDGNVAGGDGCDGSCVIEPGYACTGQPSVCTPTCAAETLPCTTDGDCCSSFCSGGSCAAACAADTFPCTVGADCCSNVCSSGSCGAPVCGGLASPCLIDNDCCLSNCVTGFCLE